MAESNTPTNTGGAGKNKKPRGRFFSVIWRLVPILLATVLAITAAALAYDKFVKKSKIHFVFGYSMLVVASPSMSGAIEAGDAIIIKKSDSYALGDVITYFPEDESYSITHRIVRTADDKFYTKGDANSDEDPAPVLKEQIAGKVVVKLDKVGYFIEWLKSPAGIIFAASTLVLLILIIVIGGNRRGKTDFADSDGN